MIQSLKKLKKRLEESTRLLNDAKVQIEAEKQNAIREIRSQVAELSVKIAEKILREKLSTGDQQMELIDKLMGDISVNKGKE